MIIDMIINFIGSAIILAIISPVIVALVAGVFIVYIAKSLYKISVPEYHEQNEGFHKVSAGLFDYIKNINTIIILRLGKYVQKDLDHRIDDIFPHLVKENKVTQLKCFLNDLLVVALNVGLIFYYIHSRSAKITCFDTIVNQLDDGYNTDIRENGVNLSGGEKQRLALTRGIYSVKDSSIILLDEPTGSLDPATEMHIYRQIFNEMSDKLFP